MKEEMACKRCGKAMVEKYFPGLVAGYLAWECDVCNQEIREKNSRFLEATVVAITEIQRKEAA